MKYSIKEISTQYFLIIATQTTVVEDQMIVVFHQIDHQRAKANHNKIVKSGGKDAIVGSNKILSITGIIKAAKIALFTSAENIIEAIKIIIIIQ